MAFFTRKQHVVVPPEPNVPKVVVSEYRNINVRCGSIIVNGEGTDDAVDIHYTTTWDSDTLHLYGDDTARDLYMALGAFLTEKENTDG